MPRGGSQPDVEYNSTSVTNQSQRLQQFHTEVLGVSAGLKDTLLSAAECICDVPDVMEQVHQLRAVLQDVVALEAEIAAHKAGMVDLLSTYAPSSSETQWGKVLRSRTEARLLSHPVNVEASMDMRRFDEEVGLAGPGAGDDDDIIIEDASLVSSDKCPLSLKPVLDLNDPVMDEKGYIYSRAALLQYINNRPCVRCPVAGTTHMLALNNVDAKKAERVIKKLRRRAKFQRAQTVQQRPVTLDAE